MTAIMMTMIISGTGEAICSEGSDGWYTETD
jgi:hypothetical protein